MQDTTNFSNR